jgi:hypothetical protein
VLDGILEIEHEGAFVSGACAFPLFGFKWGQTPFKLSTEALQHAEELATNDIGELTSALYAYNRMPRTRTWAARFPDRDSVLAHIGKSPLLAHWALVPEGRSRGWISWASTDPPPTANRQPSTVTWKLYVSRAPSMSARHSTRSCVSSRRFPRADEDRHRRRGTVASDKIVAYFATRRDLDVAANALANELRGCPAHGVPFTAAIDDDGLLSWGADPPDSERALSWLDRESWRLWIAKSLAGALAIAKRSADPPIAASIAPWQFAMERVRRRGVNVDTWTPNDTLWSPAG